MSSVPKMSRKIKESRVVAGISVSRKRIANGAGPTVYYSLLAIRYWLLSYLARLCEAVEMGEHLLDVHHVGIFVMQVEQVDLVGDERAVVGAFLYHHIVEAVGKCIDGGGAHAARGALAADDQAVD